MELTYDTLGEKRNELRQKAMEVTKKCRFLKSTTYVGVAVCSNRGNIYVGCNFDFEFGIAVHGEESAINNMVINSIDKDELLDIVYIYVPQRKQFTPCGNCRDKLRLFAADKENLIIYVDNGDNVRVYSLSELIPHYPIR